MALIAHPVPMKQKSIDLCNAFIAGAPKSATGHVFFGVTDAVYPEWRRVRKSGEDFYFIDNSYFDAARNEQFRVTKNAVQIPAERVRAAKTNGDRFAALEVAVHKWVGERNGYHLIIEQSDVFMRTTAGHATWLKDTLRELQQSPWPVKVRPWNPNKVKIQRSLPDDLAGAHEVVTHSSAAAITGMLLGIPFRVSPMSAIYGMQPEERYHFARVLADNQFTMDEMRHGVAWKAMQ